ncbi:MAG: hypothetical protein HC794_01170 [Nitrospiraceae bacterium]|nr:hypothetical protein [Nitrospiraceae bacterium]
MKVTTTLKAIRKHNPCRAGWSQLLEHLDKTKADDTPLALETVLDSNGLADALWCLRALGAEHHGWIRHYVVDCAERVKHLVTDERSIKALRIARLYADGRASDEDLAVVCDAAVEAAASMLVAKRVNVAKLSAMDAITIAASDDVHCALLSATHCTARAAEQRASNKAKWYAEVRWQTSRLRKYLRKGVRP